MSPGGPRTSRTTEVPSVRCGQRRCGVQMTEPGNPGTHGGPTGETAATAAAESPLVRDLAALPTAEQTYVLLGLVREHTLAVLRSKHADVPDSVAGAGSPAPV